MTLKSEKNEDVVDQYLTNKESVKEAELQGPKFWLHSAGSKYPLPTSMEVHKGESHYFHPASQLGNMGLAAKAVRITPALAAKELLTNDNLSQLHSFDNDPGRKIFLAEYFEFMGRRGTPISRVPVMARHPLDLYKLYQIVKEYGGFRQVVKKRKWSKVVRDLNLPSTITSAAFTLRTQYVKYLYPYECSKRSAEVYEELAANQMKYERPNVIDHVGNSAQGPQRDKSIPQNNGDVTQYSTPLKMPRKTNDEGRNEVLSDETESNASADRERDINACDSGSDDANSFSHLKRSKVDQAVETESYVNRKTCKCCGKDMELQNRDAKLHGILFSHFESKANKINGLSHSYPSLCRSNKLIRNSTPVLKNAPVTDFPKDLKQVDESLKAGKFSQRELEDISDPEDIFHRDAHPEGERLLIFERLNPEKDISGNDTWRSTSLHHGNSACEPQGSSPEYTMTEGTRKPPSVLSDTKLHLNGTDVQRDATKYGHAFQPKTLMWMPERARLYARDTERDRSAFRRVGGGISPSLGIQSTCCQEDEKGNERNKADDALSTRSRSHSGSTMPISPDSCINRGLNEMPTPPFHSVRRGSLPTQLRSSFSSENFNTSRSHTITFQIHEQTDQLLFLTVEIGGRRYDGPLFAENQDKRR